MQLTCEKVRLSSRAIRHIYLEAFPRKERMPFPLMVAMSRLWNMEFTGFYEEDQPRGLVYLAHNRRLVFVMFLAVEQSLRSRGYGSAILAAVREKFPRQKLLVSIEPCHDGAPGLALRKRRKAFYLRNGYQETGYQIKLGGVEQEVLIANGNFDKKELRRFFALYSNGTLWPKIWIP